MPSFMLIHSDPHWTRELWLSSYILSRLPEMLALSAGDVFGSTLSVALKLALSA